MLGAVEIEERAGHRVTRNKLLAFRQGLKQAPPYDLKSFLGTSRPP